ncbi:hypothetical protein [Bifidobacterium canis]|uniref:Uncharacterized protein n=1 Tax=Bifidobacterium canis TaxID=2610880 RepID=A0A7K1J3H5_9BIFI|nr:hypothetical protein [Bifidobacterium canis]MUH59187.1 hypothetical protein [Bifidobacterium canis]
MTGNLKAVPYTVTVPAGDGYDFDHMETRWRLVDTATSDIVDDAQGYGYRTAAAAYRAHGYKTTTCRRGTRPSIIKRRAQAWWRTHGQLRAELEEMQLQALKQGMPDRAMREVCTRYMHDHVSPPHGLTVPDLLRYF